MIWGGFWWWICRESSLRNVCVTMSLCIEWDSRHRNRRDLKNEGLPGKVSVYLPHSYNFSGNVFITEKKNIIPVQNSIR